MQPPTPEFATVGKAAGIVGCSRTWLFQAVSEGRIPIYRPHEKADRLVRIADVRALVESCLVAA